MLYTSKDKKRELNIDGDGKGFRSVWRRDFARLVHSPSFRRLQGKTQLFPGAESDFFRNRLTHSLEVAQISKSIAQKLNNDFPFFKNKGNKIQEDIVEFAGLAHDLGHPPFGHVGEEALDDCMKEHGGFEGNAQTLRILSKIEKKQKEDKTSEVGINKNGEELRHGLNLTYRTLASILKYDNEISYSRAKKDVLAKGYYSTEKNLVSKIKSHVADKKQFDTQNGEKFKTIECQIMDIADDIAYSTYDLDDAFKGCFLSPLNFLNVSDTLAKKIAEKVNKSLETTIYDVDKIRGILFDVFEKYFFKSKVITANKNLDFTNPSTITYIISTGIMAGHDYAQDGYQRTAFTTQLVDEAINNIEIKENEEYPALTKVDLKKEVRERVEVLKHFTFFSLIMSHLLKVPAYRGYDIVKTIFDCLTNPERDGSQLLPNDYRQLYETIDAVNKKRIICDFISGMTDKYAIEFYGRLTSENPQTIFKPL